MKSLSHCPICGNSALLPNSKVAMSRPFLTRTDPVGIETAALVHYSLCLRCGAYIQNPRMSDDDIHRYYADGLYRAWMDMNQEQADRDELARARLDATIVKDYVGATFDSHLDIGASRGHFLHEVNARAQIAVEPNEGYLTARVYAVYTDIRLMGHLQGKFDLVSALHSMEHSLDPIQFLTEAALMLCDTGKLVIEVPSENSPGGWPRLAHTFHFPTWTLHYMAARVGLNITHILFTPHTFVIMERKQS